MPDGIVEGYRLSPQQKRIWWQQLDGGAFRALCLIRIEGRLKVRILRKALTRLIARHEILRASFRHLPGIKIPLQVVSAVDRIHLPEIDLKDLSPERQSLILEDLFAQEMRGPFCWEAPSLLHLMLIAVSAETHILIVRLPALCADAHSLHKLAVEIGQCYAAGEQDDADVEPVSYLQFSEWKNMLLEEEASEEGKAYWREEASAGSGFPPLPFERSLEAEREFVFDLISIDLGEELIEKIERLAATLGSTPAQTLAACWAVLWWRVTGRPQLTVGTSFAGREYEEFESVLGPFAQWLPIQYHFHDGITFSDLAAMTKRKYQAAMRHQDSFDPEEWFAFNEGTAGFAVGFEFEQFTPIAVVDGLSLILQKNFTCLERFKVMLRCVRKPRGITAAFYFDAVLLTGDEVAYLAAQYERLLGEAIASPMSELAALSLLNDAQRRQLLIDFNNTFRDYPSDVCIHNLIERWGESAPDRIAVVCEDLQLSYGELNFRADRLARVLRRKGVGSDLPVGLYLDRSAAMITGILGILKAGAAYVPLDPSQPRKRLSSLLDELKAPCLVTAHNLSSIPPEFNGHIVYLDANDEETGQPGDPYAVGDCSPENLVYVIFTSGSTGAPKGVGVGHRQLVNYVFAVRERIGFDNGAVYATVSTFAADLGNTAIYPCLCSGGRLHIISVERAVDAEALAEYFSARAIDCLKIVPSHLQAMMAGRDGDKVLPQKHLIMGGEACGWELVERIRNTGQGCGMTNHYGPTETTIGVAAYNLRAEETATSSPTVPIGKPLANTQIYCLDEKLEPAPAGVVGELYIGGAGLARGYLRQAAATAEKFAPDPFSRTPGTRLYRTGDLARYRLDGNIEFRGRVDNQVKYHGFRIELDEIRTALNRHPQIRESVVLMAADKQGNPVPMAYYVARQEQDSAQLRAFLAETLIAETLPHFFVHLKRMPLTLNGKIDYRGLPSLDEVKARTGRVVISPRTPIEERLSSIWNRALNLDQLSILDNFFELGGHSLIATQMISRVRDSFQVEVSLRSLFECPTVEGLARVIEQKLAEKGSWEAASAPIIRREHKSITEQLAELEGLSDEQVGRLSMIDSKQDTSKEQ
jgi:amino acid adenylation domain-containing protein